MKERQTHNTLPRRAPPPNGPAPYIPSRNSEEEGSSAGSCIYKQEEDNRSELKRPGGQASSIIGKMNNYLSLHNYFHDYSFLFYFIKIKLHLLLPVDFLHLDSRMC